MPKTKPTLPSSSNLLRLRAIADSGPEGAWLLNQDHFLIGRGMGCHICLDDPEAIEELFAPYTLRRRKARNR